MPRITPGRVSLRSRIPKIQLELAPRVNEGLYRGAVEIAKTAAERAPKAESATTLNGEIIEPGNLQKSIKAARYGGAHNRAQVRAAWYWIFPEHGTKYQSAQPFMIPSAEEKRDHVIGEVRVELERL